MANPLRVIIAEDNYLVREGTRELLQASGEVKVVAAVANAEELLHAVYRLGPDAVIADIRMPPGHHMEGIVAAHQIRERDPHVGVVILSQHADEAYAFELLKDGTAGLAYLLKERLGDVRELLAALREVTAGRSVIDPQVIETLVARRSRISTSPVNTLTPRELEVLRKMAEGKTNAAIGHELALSESSVEKHVYTIFSKLQLTEEPHVHRRVAAVLTYLRDSGRAEL